MTASRLLIIVLTLMAVLFAVTLALGHRAQDNAVGFLDKWMARLPQRLNRTARVELQDIECPQRSGSRIALLLGVTSSQATIKPRKGQPVRKLELVLAGAEPLEIRFDPSPLDERATTNVVQLRPNRTNSLIVLEHGGALKFTRKTALSAEFIDLR